MRAWTDAEEVNMLRLLVAVVVTLIWAAAWVAASG
jgi:hypothetical protein